MKTCETYKKYKKSRRLISENDIQDIYYIGGCHKSAQSIAVAKKKEVPKDILPISWYCDDCSPIDS